MYRVTPGVVARKKGGFLVQENRPLRFCRYIAIVVKMGVVKKKIYCMPDSEISSLTTDHLNLPPGPNINILVPD